MSLNKQVTSPVGGPGCWIIGALGPGPSVAVRFGELAQPPGEPPQDGQRDGRLLLHDRLEVPRREGKTGGRLVSDHLGDPRPSVEHRQLPEEVAGPDPGDRLAVADDPDSAGRDEEEAGPDLALAGDDVVLREIDLDHPRGDHRDAL